MDQVEMGKFIFIFISFLSFFYSAHAIARNKQAAFYLGLEPEISTLDDTIRILGTPVSKIISDKLIIYKYRIAEITIDKKTKKIGIILIKDQAFKDANGFMIGDPYEKISKELNNTGKGNAIYDKKKGIIYIFNENGVLEEIVYGSLSK
ncbi:MAG: hypothetical protein PHI97_00740 [Desulfobulbus sp.]|nr:hypothetical protein [Desulfobulbus sp.]